MCNARVFETLVFHDVAPVACAVADTDQEGFVFSLCLCQGLFSPWHPIYGIVRMLKQVGTRFVDQCVGICFRHCCCVSIGASDADNCKGEKKSGHAQRMALVCSSECHERIEMWNMNGFVIRTKVLVLIKDLEVNLECSSFSELKDGFRNFARCGCEMHLGAYFDSLASADTLMQ